MRLPLELPDEVVDAIAERAAAIVLERLADGDRGGRTYVTVEEAAAFLGCRSQRIYELRSAGKLTRFQDGSRALVSRAELEARVTVDGGGGLLADERRRSVA